MTKSELLNNPARTKRMNRLAWIVTAAMGSGMVTWVFMLATKGA